MPDTIYKLDTLRIIQANFGLNWPSGFRGEDFWKKLTTYDGRRTTDDGRQVMTKAHMAYGQVS